VRRREARPGLGRAPRRAHAAHLPFVTEKVTRRQATRRSDRERV
jgi:hypothetical protein